MKKYILLTFMLSQSCYTKNITPGFCSVPIADLLGAPIQSFFNISSAQKAYKKIPYSEKTGHLACPRMAQLIFNEPVQILEKRGKEVKIKVPHLAYPTKNGFQDTYWTLAKNITPLTKNLEKTVPLNNKHTITLRVPLYNPTNQHTYCAGTKFVKNHHRQTKNKYSVTLYDPQTKNITHAHIPHSACLAQPHSKQALRATIVNLCRSWAHPKKGFIPYVFGGSSIQSVLQNETYSIEPVNFTQKKVFFYERTPHTSPRAGVDCARMFTRAIQMVGIPFKATNTKGFGLTLRSLGKNEALENGDLILWNGHIAMISNTQKGLLIEARSYDHGYGKVQEIPFSEQFKEIITTQDLKHAYLANMPITRLNKDGKKVQTIYNIKLLKLSSLWENS